MMYTHILVAFDGSPNADKALQHAVRLIQQGAGTKLTAVHVAHSPLWTLGHYASAPPAEYLEWSREHAAAVAERAKQVTDSLPFGQTVVLNGNPASEIIDYAAEYHCDLIVIGSRGLGRIKELMLGSVSHHVVLQAKVPVLIVK